MTDVTVWHYLVRVNAVHVKSHSPLTNCTKWEVGNGEPCVWLSEAERPARGPLVTSAQQWIAMNANDATTNQAAWLLGLFYDGVLDIYVYIPDIPYIIIHLVIAVMICPLCASRYLDVFFICHRISIVGSCPCLEQKLTTASLSYWKIAFSRKSLSKFHAIKPVKDMRPMPRSAMPLYIWDPSLLLLIIN